MPLILKEAHLEWMLQVINDGNIKGKDLQLGLHGSMVTTRI